MREAGERSSIGVECGISVFRDPPVEGGSRKCKRILRQKGEFPIPGIRLGKAVSGSEKGKKSSKSEMNFRILMSEVGKRKSEVQENG